MCGFAVSVHDLSPLPDRILTGIIEAVRCTVKQRWYREPFALCRLEPAKGFFYYYEQNTRRQL